MYRDYLKGDYERYNELLHETNVMYRDSKGDYDETLKVATARYATNVMYRDSKGDPHE